MTKITLHRALAELKLADSKINKLIDEILPSGIHQKDRLINGVMKEEEFKRITQSKYDSVNELIERKNKLKVAIVAANAITKVTVGGKEMTIADAINFKTIIGYKKTLIDTLKSRHRTAVSQLNRQNDIVESNVQKLLEAAFGKENVKVSKEDLDAVRKPYVETNEWHLFDPLKVEEKIEKMEKEVADFETDVDAALSEINAVTLIEI